MVDNVRAASVMKWEFLSMEYQAAQQRLLQTGLNINRIENYLPAALGAFYAWIWSQHIPEGVLYRGLVTIPIALIVIAFIRHRSELQFMYKTAEYVDKLESRMVDAINDGEAEHLLGFERHYRTNDKGKKFDPFLKLNVAYWGMIFFGAISIRFYFPALWPPQ